MQIIANVRVGTPDVSRTQSAHVRGVREGNNPTRLERRPGLISRGLIAVATAAHSTGINPEDRNPIDPQMPNLPPP